MAGRNGRHPSRTKVWRAWCPRCVRHLAMSGHWELWPDEIRCPLCGGWRKVVARGAGPLAGDLNCAPGSGRNRLEE